MAGRWVISLPWKTSIVDPSSYLAPVAIDLTQNLGEVMIKSANSDADRIRTHGINHREPDANATGYGSDAELIRTHGINTPKTAFNDILGPVTGAQRIGAAQLDQPAAVTALIDSDLGLMTVAERIRTQRNR